MLFVLGFISGLLLAAITFIVLAFFRLGIERQIKIIETKLEHAGPRSRGAIYLPEDEATAARSEIIKRNKEQGKDTPINELM